MVAVHDVQAFDRLAGPRRHGRVPDQPLIRGADGDHVRAARQPGAVWPGITKDIDRRLIGTQSLFGPQRGLHRLVEPGRFQPSGEPLAGAGDEPCRHRRTQKRCHQHRGPLSGHVALRTQQDGGGVDVRPIHHRPGLPIWRVRAGHRSAAGTAQFGQQPVHLLQPHRQGVPHLPPPPPRRLSPGQARPARPALRWRLRLPGPVRVSLRLQARAQMTWLTAGLALLGPFPQRRPPGRLLARLGPQRLLRWRGGGVAAVHRQTALQLRDPQLQPLDQLSLAGLARLQRRVQRRDLDVLGLRYLAQPGVGLVQPGIGRTQRGQLIISRRRGIGHNQPLITTHRT